MTDLTSSDMRIMESNSNRKYGTVISHRLMVMLTTRPLTTPLAEHI